jgi:hypothetical protein
MQMTSLLFHELLNRSIECPLSGIDEPSLTTEFWAQSYRTARGPITKYVTQTIHHYYFRPRPRGETKLARRRQLARVDCLAGFMRLDLSEGTRDYQYHPDGPTTRQAAPVRGLGLTKSVS